MQLTWDSVLAWRMRRQFLDRSERVGAVEIARRLCGLQAQVDSAARLAVSVRQPDPARDDVQEALDDRTLMRTWAARGTLHLLPVDDAAAQLALLAAVRTWEKGAWQRTFVDTDQLNAITEAASEALNDRVLTRQELVTEVVERTGDPSLADKLSSGWGAVLKPLAWQGYLCNGPAMKGNVTFTSPATWLPSWPGLPDPAEAARTVIPAYLGAHGPASIQTFDQWLCRGASKMADLRRWFADLDDQLVTVEVEGEPLYARAEDVDDIASTAPDRTVRLLPGFDQYILGPGTSDTHLIPADQRQEISRAGGWISPVVIVGGRVVGTWQVATDTIKVTINIFYDSDSFPALSLDAEAERIADHLGTPLKLSVNRHTAS
jgi:Winged helix DNA-binding domain